MRRLLPIAIAVVTSGLIAFFAGGRFVSKDLLVDYNEMASDNFATALLLFRNGFETKRIIIFGESEEHSNFKIDDYEFVVIPDSRSISDQVREPLHPEIGNMASHLNGMAVMLACKWSQDGDPRGQKLLAKLKEIAPNFALSAPSLGTVTIEDLQEGSQMMKSEADQWNWRMDNLNADGGARQGDQR